jgi:glycosyltransferase involved in cell wall biosynthesis
MKEVKEKKDLPSVDIVIAARNEERHLRACLNALQAQDYPQDLLKIYVVDDGSTDRTAEIARDCGVLLLQQPQRGAAAARNFGIGSGNGELIGLLDAHCYTKENWVRVMAEQFVDPQLGGCQASINNKSDDKRVQKYLESSGALSNELILSDTVKGVRNLYPWILSGNSMYRRSALEEAGCFNESLVACEDVDLAWRVILLGYHLRYVPQVEATHYDHNSWRGFIQKGFRYGAGAAQLAQIYKLHGTTERNSFSDVSRTSLERFLSGSFYWAGFKSKILKMKWGLDNRPSPQQFKAPLARFRSAQEWDEQRGLQLSPETIYWFNDTDISMIVNQKTRVRIVLRTTGNFIWRRIIAGVGRDELIQELGDYYNVSSVTAGSDVDDFVEELIDAGIINEIPGRSNSALAGVA